MHSCMADRYCSMSMLKSLGSSYLRGRAGQYRQYRQYRQAVQAVQAVHAVHAVQAAGNRHISCARFCMKMHTHKEP